MKLTGSRIASYLARAPEEVRVALFHGEEGYGAMSGPINNGESDALPVELSPSDSWLPILSPYGLDLGTRCSPGPAGI